VSSPTPRSLGDEGSQASRGEVPRGHVFFPGDVRLEGVLEWPGREGMTRPRGGVVIAHPHPLYGGTMAQPVVFRVARACQEQGFATLRFNFRGVGGSAGTYNGREEYRDVEAALRYLEAQLSRGQLTGVASADSLSARSPSTSEGTVDGPGVPRLPLAVAGYSFGSVMAALAAGRGEVGVDALVLIALPIFWDELPLDLFRALREFRGSLLAVCGEGDDLAPPGAVAGRLEELKLRFELRVIPGVGHLFEGRQQEVGEVVAHFLADLS